MALAWRQETETNETRCLVIGRKQRRWYETQ
jgi:hypothetical protein